LIWRPWSLHAFDPEMRMPELTFVHVRRFGIPTGMFADLLQRPQSG